VPGMDLVRTRRAVRSLGRSGGGARLASPSPRPIDAMRATWPCRHCTARGDQFPVGRVPKCGHCDGVGIDLVAVANELAQRSRECSARARVLEDVEAALEKPSIAPEKYRRGCGLSVVPWTDGRSEVISAVRAALAHHIDPIAPSNARPAS